MEFSAVILVGGRSRRMGRDKALLEVEGEPLLARQIRLVRAAGASEVLISGRAVADYAGFGLPLLVDLQPDGGPLGGVERALATALHPLVLTLAVDLPRMRAGFLRELLERCSASTGLVPRTQQGWEPLAAVYPKTAHEIAAGHLRAGRRTLSEFVEECVERKLVIGWPCPAALGEVFTNWNQPRDMA